MKNKKTTLLLLFYGLFLLITAYFVLTECFYLFLPNNDHKPLSSIKQAHAQEISETNTHEGNTPTLEPQETPHNAPQATQTIKAYITAYSAQDSCHYPNSEGLCLAANGQPIQNNTVACPRSLPLGTKVMINNHIYTCQDRYATYLDAQRGLPTFDVWMGYGQDSYNQAKKFGLNLQEVIIIN